MSISKNCAGAALFLLCVVLTAAGCSDGAEKSCGPSNCEGCCGAGGKCWPGVEPATCGAGGAACKDCADNGCEDGSCSNVDGTCTPDKVEEKGCGNCGTRTRQCTKQGAWGPWSLCTDEGTCSSSSTENQACGNCGTQTRVCTDGCSWGEWGACTNEGVCGPAAADSQACGSCGTQSRVCTDGCAWGEWSACTGEHGCAPTSTDMQACGNCQSQTRVCSTECAWGDWGSCNGGPVCTAGKTETRQCGDCGTQSRVCSGVCAWSDWSSCEESLVWENFRAKGTDYSLEVRVQQDRTVWVGTTGGLVRSKDRGVTWEGFSKEDGIGGDEVNSLLIDGNTVIACSNGGFSYTTDDGATWKTVNSAKGLPSDYVYVVVHASDGTYWVGTYLGVSHGPTLEGPWTTFGAAQGLPANRVEDLLEGPDGSIWVAVIATKAPGVVFTSDGGKTWTPVDLPDDLGPNNENPAQGLYFDSQKALWISTWNDGLYRRGPENGASWTRFGPLDYGETGNTYVEDFVENPLGTLWIATAGMPGTGVSITQNSGGSWIKRNNLCSAVTYSLDGDDLGRVYATTPGCGLSWSDDLGASWSKVSLTVGAPANALTATSRGPGNSIWVGTIEDHGGFTLDGGKTWTKTIWPSAGSGGSNVVNSMFYDDQATPPALWIATLSGLFRTTDGGQTFTAITAANGLGADDVRSVFVDWSSGKQIIWAATGSGMDDSPGGASKSIDGGETWVNFTRDDLNYGSNNSTDVFVDHQGVLWVATASGLRRSPDKGATWETWIYKLNSTVPTWYFSAVWVEPDGTIWIAGQRANDEVPMAAAKSTDGGNSWTRYHTGTGIGVDDNGTRLYRDPKTGTIYLGTADGGAYWTQDQGASWCHAGTNSGLGSNWVTGITVSDSGAVVLATRNGLAFGTAK